MQRIKKTVIIANGNKEHSAEISLQMSRYLEQKGVLVTSYLTKSSQDTPEISKDCDLVVSIGGDGTVLSTARLVQDLGIPILAVNLGTFGYITEIGESEWKDAVDDILVGKAGISRRLMLRVTVFRDGKKVWQQMALNEAVVTSAGISKIIRLSLSLDNTMAGNFRSDGMIIATPTGSTGYSLAAGGPILEAGMSAIIITPICPFTLSNRPLVTSGETHITIKVLPCQRTGVILTVDGQMDYTLFENDEVVVERSRSKVLLIASKLRNYTEMGHV